MKITRKEYNEALDVIEAYQKQIFLNPSRDLGKTLIKDWDKLNLCSTRLTNALKNLYIYYCFEEGKYLTKDIYIEDLTRIDILKSRNVGKQTLFELEGLLGRDLNRKKR